MKIRKEIVYVVIVLLVKEVTASITSITNCKLFKIKIKKN